MDSMLGRSWKQIHRCKKGKWCAGKPTHGSAWQKLTLFEGSLEKEGSSFSGRLSVDAETIKIK